MYLDELIICFCLSDEALNFWQRKGKEREDEIFSFSEIK
jgi:hypothetical protein